MATIISEKTGNPISVKEFEISSKEALRELTAARSTQSLGYWVLQQAVDLMETTIDGDSSKTNFALSIFENALDWRLGSLAKQCIQLAHTRQRHHTLRIGIDRHGDIWSMKTNRTLDI